ncbi:MAG: hypothetical protein ACXWL2_02285 [Candidatus Chromulinivorax sp.]
MKILKSFLISFLMISFAGLQGSDTSDTSFESEVSIEPVRDLTIKYCPEEAKFKVIEHRKFEEPTAVDQITKVSLIKNAKRLCDTLNDPNDSDMNYIIYSTDIRSYGFSFSGYRTLGEKYATSLEGAGLVELKPGVNKDYVEGKLEKIKQSFRIKHGVFIDWDIQQ